MQRELSRVPRQQVNEGGLLGAIIMKISLFGNQSLVPDKGIRIHHTRRGPFSSHVSFKPSFGWVVQGKVTSNVASSRSGEDILR